MRKKGIIILVVVLVILVILEAVLFFTMRGRTGQANTAPAALMTQSPEMTVAPTPTEVPVTPTPEPTPTPTPQPTEIPTPTPEPTVPPTPTPVPSQTGTISSDTGTSLNYTVEWKTESLGNGSTRLHLTGKLSSYSLNVMGSAVTLTFAGQSTTCEVPSFNISGSQEVISDMFYGTIDVPTGTSGTLTADWNIRCTYSGVALSHVTASGEVTA